MRIYARNIYKNLKVFVKINKGRRNIMDNYCNNEKCNGRYNCPIFRYVNPKVTSEFFIDNRNPETCGYYRKRVGNGEK